MSDSKSSYQQILKATSIFGGLQVYNILMQLIRSKLVAILLGPNGMGIVGLITSTLSIVTSLTSFGIGTSATRNVSQANESGNADEVIKTASILKKLVLITGLLGTFVTLFLSPILSKLTFGNYDYTLAFALLSVTLILGQISVGQTVLLQGMRRISWLAQAGIYSSTASFLVTIPLYYFFGIKGIVPGILLSSVIVVIVQNKFVQKINIQSQYLTVKETLKNGKGILKLGFVLSLNGLVTTAASYLIRIFISNYGNLEDVGFFNAGFAIINTYVGMVFSAMIVDYYPRLAAVSNEVEKFKNLINQQIEISIYIISPIICAFLLLINWLVILIYSKEFLPIVGMIQWGILGIYFKTLSWSIGILLAAKGNSKHLFWNEIIANSYMLIFNVLGYYWGGLEGLGISFLLGYCIHLIQIYFFTKTVYQFRLTRKVLSIFIFSLVTGFLSFILTYSSEKFLFLLLNVLIFIIVLCFSLYQINKKINLLNFIKTKLNKK